MKSIIKTLSHETMSQKLAGFFSTAEETAREIKFVQRRSRLTGLVFLQTLVFGFLQNPKASLTHLAQECSRLGVAISPQGIDERINERSVEFVKEMYQRAFEQFQNRVALPIEILSQFSKLFLVDSTFKVLPESMAEEFPGSGGKASKASLKVQLVFEFLYGNLEQLVVQAGRAADQAFTQYLELVEKGSLVIMDLGYFRLASLRAIADRGAYFIIRYHYPTALLHPDGSRIDLLGWLGEHEDGLWETPILLGASAQKQVACRLISTPVPLAVAEERRRKANFQARLHGKTLTQAYLKSLGWSVFVTNVPPSMLTSSQVLDFYRVRWQIELIFKLWKSYCGLDHIRAARRERVLTEFYAKLLVAVLTCFLTAPLRVPDAAQPKREISTIKVREILADFGRYTALNLLDPAALQQVLEQLYQQIGRFGFKQIRGKKPNVCALLASLCSPALAA